MFSSGFQESTNFSHALHYCEVKEHWVSENCNISTTGHTFMCSNVPKAVRWQLAGLKAAARHKSPTENQWELIT